MRLLLVEDTPDVSDAVRASFQRRGDAVDHADTLERAFDCVATNDYDVVILDVSLPDGLGTDLLTSLRRARKATPVLVLTARMAVDDRVSALDQGADDYLVKPFAFSELVARIEVLLRRAAGAAPAPDALLLSLGDLQVDLARRRAVRAGQRLELSAKEFQLLTLLMRRKGEVLSRTEIAEQVWDVNFDHGTNVIDVAIRRLRGKLDLPFEHPLLHTVRGMGYVLEDRSS